MNRHMVPDGDSPGTTLTQDVYERLRADILNGCFAPGLKLKVAALSAHYETGASPIREALSRLSSEDLVTKTEKRGFRVAEIDERSYRDIFEVRCLIESDALRRSIARGDQSWEDQLTLAFFRLDRASRADEYWEDKHRAFHMALVAGSQSELLTRYVSELYDQAVRYRNLSRSRLGRKRDGRDEHRRIFEAAIGREADAAVSALIEHYRNTLDVLADPANPPGVSRED